MPGADWDGDWVQIPPVPPRKTPYIPVFHWGVGGSVLPKWPFAHTVPDVRLNGVFEMSAPGLGSRYARYRSDYLIRTRAP
ncbi:hypothetical protein CLE01_33660 [Cryobacterium levicorallinum]|nr:hypothetical protein CLE01_33660 [Cryobacterium levicorallinum]